MNFLFFKINSKKKFFRLSTKNLIWRKKKYINNKFSLQKETGEDRKKRLEIERKKAEEFDEMATQLEISKTNVKQLEAELKKTKEELM